MKNLSAQETLLTALPILLILLALVGAIIFIPEGSVLDIRGRASRPTPTPTIVRVPTATPTTRPPETACSDLYKPVCSTATNRTYANECEAAKEGALPVRQGECTAAPTRLVTPVTFPTVTQ